MNKIIIKIIVTFVIFITIIQAKSLNKNKIYPVKSFDTQPLEMWIANESKYQNLFIEFTQHRKLRIRRKVSKHQGLLWIKNNGDFRWQLGIPAKTTILKVSDKLKVKNHGKNKVKVTSLKDEKVPNKFKFMVDMFSNKPKSVDEFETKFDVIGIRKDDLNFIIKTKPKDKKMSKAINNIKFYVDKNSYLLKIFELNLGEKTKITTHFTNIEEVENFKAGVFKLNIAK